MNYITLIDVKTIADTIGVSVRTCNERIVRRADFPRPALAINHKTRRWAKDAFDAWLKKQAKDWAR